MQELVPGLAQKTHRETLSQKKNQQREARRDLSINITLRGSLPITELHPTRLYLLKVLLPPNGITGLRLRL